MDSEFYKYKCDTRKYINLEGGYVMRLEFLGAAHVVTGSCYLLHVGDHRYLIDCGMLSGNTSTA